MLWKMAVTTLAVGSLALLATPALAQIESFDATPLEPSFGSYQEIDFEGMESSRISGTSVRIRGVEFSDPLSLSAGFCSSPTCSPDPQNPNSGNNEIFLNPGGAIEFPSAPGLVVLDIQGIGDNPFELEVSDGMGQSLAVNSQGVLFGRTLVGLRAAHGVRRIVVTSVGGTLGPLAVARVLYSQSGQ